jgi:hypothetical protein
MVCHRCKKQGHIQKDCRVKLPETGNDNSELKKKYGNQKRFTGKKSNLLAICTNVMNIQNPEGSESLRCVSGTVDGVPFKMALDSGATCSIISAGCTGTLMCSRIVRYQS